MKNVEQTIISQYGNSATITRLIADMNENIDPAADIDMFFDYVFNVETAEGFGLDDWGRIVGVSRIIPSTPAYVLDDEQFRALILLKALSNISYDSAPSINRLLLNWFGGTSRAYVSDLGGMAMRYTFEFTLEPYQVAIVTSLGIFLRGAGVYAFAMSSDFPVFGFSEAGTLTAAPFGQAPFISEDAIYAVG